MNLTKYLTSIGMPEDDLHLLSEMLIQDLSLEDIQNQLSKQYSSKEISAVLSMYCREFLDASLDEVAPNLYEETTREQKASQIAAIEQNIQKRQEKAWDRLLEDLNYKISES